MAPSQRPKFLAGGALYRISSSQLIQHGNGIVPTDTGISNGLAIDQVITQRLFTRHQMTFDHHTKHLI